jgi:hypothetical protein
MMMLSRDFSCRVARVWNDVSQRYVVIWALNPFCTRNWKMDSWEVDGAHFPVKSQVFPVQELGYEEDLRDVLWNMHVYVFGRTRSSDSATRKAVRRSAKTRLSATRASRAMLFMKSQPRTEWR